ncbi:rabphilin-3A [Parasteatoda tepidariorum]|uniref:rabphilin-3A n=1 Tax=Parasteatoda tepidariorum TaxID=114398 RepID=UPI0039BCAB20
MGDFGMARDKWVCPNDRELSLRAKLKTGWSVKTNSINSFNKPETLSDAEQEVIMGVIKRAENLDKVEQERVGRLVDRLDNMKKNAMGNGSTQCVLCAEEFGILGQSQLCKDCEKAVCSKCGLETLSAHKEPLFLCRICAETRETWKKSGAWFYRGLPKYILPSRKTEPSKYSSTPSTPLKSHEQNTPLRSYNPNLQTKGRSGSDREYTDSSDEEFRSSRFTKKGTVRKQHVDSVENNEPSVTNLQPMVASDLTSPRPSPTHLYSPVVPESVQHRDVPNLEQNRSPGYEGYSPYAKDSRRGDEDRIQTPTSSSTHWYKPNTRSQPPEQEEYPERTYRGHVRKESQHSPRHRTASLNRSEENFEEKSTVEESSTLEFSLLFDAHNQVLHCTIYRAKGLKPTDCDGLADPYVRLHLLPIQSKMDKLRTRTVHKTLNPEFNEAISFYGISDYDIQKRTLRMTVMDEDTHCHEPVGEIRLSLKKLRPQQPSYATVTLEKPRYFHFCSRQMKPDPVRRRFKTSIKKKTLNPEYNEQFAFEVDPQDMLKRTLEVTVWDKDTAKSELYIGGLALNMQSKGERLRHWLDVMSNPNRRIERWHPLSNVVFID